MISETYLLGCGYTDVRQLKCGVWIGLMGMNYTTGLFVGLDETGYASRYCYEHRTDALDAFLCWEGQGDPSGPWVMHKGARGGDRLNPRLKDEVL